MRRNVFATCVFLACWHACMGLEQSLAGEATGPATGTGTGTVSESDAGTPPKESSAETAEQGSYFGGKDQADPVVATVGSEVIRLSELRLPKGPPNSQEQMTAALLAAVRERAAYIAALRDGFDLDAAVANRIARARRSITTEAFLDARLAKLIPMPSEQEVSDFIASKPDYFADRRVYRLTQLIVQFKQPGDAARLTDKIQSYSREIDKQYANANDFALWLRQQGFLFQRAVVSRGSEEISESILPTIKTLDQIGNAILPGEDGNQFQVVFLHAVSAEPANPQLARDNVRAGLYAKLRSETLEKLVDDLVAQADIRILDEKLKTAVTIAPERAASPIAVAPRTATVRDRLRIFWLPFVTIVGSFLAIRLVVLARQPWRPEGEPISKPRKTLAIVLPALAGLSIWASNLFILRNSKGVFDNVIDHDLLPIWIGGILGGMFLAVAGYRVSISSRPYPRCAMALALLVACQVGFLVSA